MGAQLTRDLLLGSSGPVRNPLQPTADEPVVALNFLPVAPLFESAPVASQVTS